MDFRRILNHNWPYKTAAVVLSLLMWLSVSCPSEMVVGLTEGVTEVEALQPGDLQVLGEVSDPIDEGRSISHGVVFSHDLSANAYLVPATVNVASGSDPLTFDSTPE